MLSFVLLVVCKNQNHFIKGEPPMPGCATVTICRFGANIGQLKEIDRHSYRAARHLQAIY
jgi:hypothetical protein